MSAKLTRGDILRWEGLVKEFGPKLHSGNPQVLLSEIGTLLGDRGYSTTPMAAVGKSEIGDNIKLFDASLKATKVGKAATSIVLALRIVGAILIVFGVILLPFYGTFISAVVLIFVGAIILILSFAGKPTAPVGTLGVTINGFTYPTVLKEKEEVVYVSFELRITVGAVIAVESKGAKEVKKEEPVKEDFEAVCQLINRFLK